MKMRLFWLPCLMFLFGTFCASCGSDDNEPTDEPGAGGTEVKGDYTATTAVKTAVLKYNLKWSSAEIPVYYEDFNRSMDCISRVGVLVYFLLYVKVGYGIVRFLLIMPLRCNPIMVYM